MPPSLTVEGFRTAQKSRLAQALTEGQKDLATVDAQLAAARQDAQAKAGALAALQQAEAAIRAQLATASMPADVDQLEQNLEANLLAQGPAAAAIAAAQDTVAVKTLERQRVVAAADRTRTRLAEVEAALVLAAQDDHRASAWRTALTGGDVTGLVAEATSAPVTTLAGHASNNLTTWLGNHPELFTLLKARYDDAVSEADDLAAAVQRAAQALNAVLARRSPGEAAVVEKADAYARSRQAVAALVEQGEQRLAWAKQVLASAAGPSPVTASEQPRIDTRAVAVVSAQAADKEQAIHAAMIVARNAAAELERVTLPKKALDPTYDPALDSSVDQVRTAAVAAADAVNAARNDFKAGNFKAAIDQWEVAVPQVLMALATDVLRALTVIDELKVVDPLTVDSDFDMAEGNYAQALAAQDALEQLVDAATAEVAQRMDDAAAVAPLAEVRLAAVVRGDE